MGALLQCSACLFREDVSVSLSHRSQYVCFVFLFEGLLFQTNQMSADYLFQQDKPYDVSYDTGECIESILSLYIYFR